MDGHLITADGTEHPVDEAAVTRLLGADTRFWLDLTGGTERDIEAMLSGTFGFHDLAVEDAQHFGQRPKLDAYDDFTLLVVYGAADAGQLIEVHCFYTERYLVTVHHAPCPDLTALRRRLASRLERRVDAEPDHIMLLHQVIDTLVDGYFPMLATLDDQIDALEDEILQRPTDRQLGQLFDLKRSLIALRKVVTPQRDMFAALLSGREALPGMTPESERYFRDLYDHTIRISDLVDSYRDLISGVLDTHLSTVSNRLNVVMKQLTVIATVFLPLSFLTGFFGQNFGWLVDRLGGLPVFLGAGLGLEVLAVLALVVFFRRRGWLSSDGTVPSGAPAERPHLAREKRWKVVHLAHAEQTGPRR